MKLIIATLALTSLAASPASTQDGFGKFKKHGVLWELELTHDDVNRLAVARTATGLIPEPTVVAFVNAVIETIVTVDTIGGRKGVTITGTLVDSTVVILPRGMPFYDDLIRAQGKAKEEVQQGLKNVSVRWPRPTKILGTN